MFGTPQHDSGPCLLQTPMLGCFRWSSKGTSPTCLAHIFAMSVAEELETWPEKDFRTRKWVCPLQTCSR